MREFVKDQIYGLLVGFGFANIIWAILHLLGWAL